MMRSRLGCQAFGSARVTLPGIELMPRLKKGQWVVTMQPARRSLRNAARRPPHGACG